MQGHVLTLHSGASPLTAKAVGDCALTGVHGKFVKCHLLPRALTLPRPGGRRFPQLGEGLRPTKRLDSWYDSQLVTAEGEAVLAELDAFGIAALRKHKLLWQSWGPMVSFEGADYLPFPAEPHGMRLIDFERPQMLRRFLLSLLWRAAATSRFEFKEVAVKASDLRRLRSATLGKWTPPESFFPATLVQLTSAGPPHNLAPIKQMKRIPTLPGAKGGEVPIFRFYLDGLIVHFHLNPTAERVDGMQPFLIGKERQSVVSTVRYEASWQLENLDTIVEWTRRKFPAELAKSGGA